MRVAPTTLEKLAFGRVVGLLADRAATPLGRALALRLAPDLERSAVDVAFERTDELLGGADVGLGGVEDVRPLVERVREGQPLDGREILAIASTMDTAGSVRRSLAQGGRPRMTELAERMSSFDAPLRLVREQLDPNGEVRDDATPKLREIRRRLHPLRGRIRERLAQLLQQHAEHVQDPIVTLRRDRYVIPVKASAQARVPGIVLDTSDSGQTVFVEPSPVVPMNNELALLEFEDRDEVRRILIALGQRLAFDPGLDGTLVALAELDLASASARLARDLGLRRPELGDGLPLRLPRACHPLIEGCVANDVELTPDERALIVTGPNAGGKTVLLKTVGLAVLMAHAGLFVAAGAGGEDRRRPSIPWTAAVLTDIGDEQSIEASLSTYAGHLTNLRRIVERCGPDSLVLIDELGSGTDPDEGAALSQAILETVLERRAYALVTTHLAPLKVFASRRAGVRNAAMRFDVDALLPTFELVVGQPGRSYALAIARRIGLDDALITRAEELLGPEGARLERLLETLEAQREELERQVEEATEAADVARREADTLRRQIDTLREREAELMARAAEQADELLRGTMEQARRLRRTAATEPQGRGQAIEALQALRRDTRSAAGAGRGGATPPAPRVAAGAVVRVASYGAEGPVLEERGDQVVVQLGLLKVEVPRRDVTLVRGADAGPERRRSGGEVAPMASPPPELNVRGERAEAAIELVRDFVLEAHATKRSPVRILHGKGTGALRDAVRSYLKGERLVERFEDAVPYEGGHGVTVAYLRT